MTVALLTITHDEPDTVQQMLASADRLVDGPRIAWHIGERDDTAEIMRELGVEVHRRPWDNFDGSWSSLFAYARFKADRLLYLQANSVLVEHGPLPELGEVPCYMIRYRRGPYEYRLPNLLDGGLEWFINAPVHGTLEPSYFDERLPLDAWLVQESDDDGRRPEKLARYLPLMQQQVAENPSPRNVFYLARTYFDLGRFDEALEYYDWRIRLGGWSEEQWHAMYMRGVSLIRLSRFDEGRNALLAAYHYRPTRAEPLHAICQSMYPPTEDLLFVEHDVYAQR